MAEIDFKLSEGKIELRSVTSIRIPREMSDLLDAYKAIVEPKLDKERIVLKILNSNLKEFREGLSSLKFK
ncbi:MAG TPA: hypothetical protein DHU69_06515 [Deltaproteobacteria bacterium]|nr:hypothetical protein [Deltaproteobacteria bacterium]